MRISCPHDWSGYVAALSDDAVASDPGWGGKARSLASLVRWGHDVPRGVVLHGEALEIVVATLALRGLRDMLDESLAARDLAQARAAAAALHAGIAAASVPEDLVETVARALGGDEAARYAVRSSSTSEDVRGSAAAGVFTTVLGVPRHALGEAIRAVWKSLFAPSALAYFLRVPSASTAPRMAVIVQTMLRPRYAGVAFSRHPLEPSSEEVVIEATRGLGEAVASGTLKPERYLVTPEAGLEPAVEGAGFDALALARVCRTIEARLGTPVDVEWASDDGGLWLLQARPITAWSPVTASGRAETGSGGSVADSYVYWYSDVLSYWSVEATAKLMRDRREIAWNQIDRHVLRTEHGFTTAYVSASDVARWKARGSALSDPARADRLRAEMESAMRDNEPLFSELAQEDVHRAEARRLGDLYRRAVERYGVTLSFYKATGTWPTGALVDLLRPHHGGEDLLLLLLPREIDVVAEEEIAWSELSETSPGPEVLLGHVARFPWLAQGHSSHASVVAALEDRRRTSRRLPKRSDVLERKRALSERQAQILGDSPGAALVSTIQMLARMRSALKAIWASFDYRLLDLFTEVAARRGETVEAMQRYYRVDEISSLIDDGRRLSDVEKERRERCSVVCYVDGELSFHSGEQASSVLAELPLTRPGGSTLEGTVASTGGLPAVRGRARRLPNHDVARLAELRRGIAPEDILVTSMVQFDCLDLIERTRGVVTDEGGMLSHAAIVAREMGLPCIVGTEQATTVIPEGALIEMDLIRGTVRVLT